MFTWALSASDVQVLTLEDAELDISSDVQILTHEELQSRSFCAGFHWAGLSNVKLSWL